MPEAGKWTLPGGGIEFGEDPEAAMIREVEEETGLHVSSAGLAGIDSFTHDAPERSFHGLRIIYHANVLDGVIKQPRDTAATSSPPARVGRTSPECWQPPGSQRDS